MIIRHSNLKKDHINTCIVSLFKASQASRPNLTGDIYYIFRLMNLHLTFFRLSIISLTLFLLVFKSTCCNSLAGVPLLQDLNQAKLHVSPCLMRNLISSTYTSSMSALSGINISWLQSVILKTHSKVIDIKAKSLHKHS